MSVLKVHLVVTTNVKTWMEATIAPALILNTIHWTLTTGHAWVFANTSDTRMKRAISFIPWFSYLYVADINECETDNGGCQHICFNTYGSHFCDCRQGYHLLEDNITCEGM